MSVNKVNSDGSLLRVAGGTLYADSPIGTIVPFGGSVTPKGYLLCDGAEVLKTTYAELYAVIGDAFGTASVNTKFVLPDLRESVPKGAGLTGKTVGNHLDADGLAVGEFLDDRVQTHEHYIGDSATPQHLGYSDPDGQNAGIGNRTVDATIESDRKWIALGQTNVGIARSGRYGNTTEVKSVGVNYIIKAKMVALPADLESAVADAVDEAMADTGWVTVNSYVKARRIGKMVSLELTFTKSAISAANWTKVADLEARFRPSKQAIGCAYTYVTGSEIQFDNYYINSATGAVSLLGNTDLIASITYFAD